MECLDKEYWEMDLHATLEEMKEEVQAHMDITEDLTNKARGNNKAYLSAANGTHHGFFTLCDSCKWREIRLVVVGFHTIEM